MDREVKKRIIHSGGWLKRFAEEFRTFAVRGNMIDMAVGIIVGGALSKVVSSIVGDIMMPLFNVITGRLGRADWVIALGAEEGAPQLMLGSFISNIADFIILAFRVFIIVRVINRVTGALKPPQPPAPPARTCPFCMQKVEDEATRCPHCTSHIGNTGEV